jgi:hypothetical protein
VRSTKYREIWKLEILLDYIRKDPPLEELSGVELMGRAGAVFMIFIPCRPIEMWRIRVEESKQSSYDKAVEVPTRERTNTCKGSTIFLLRAGLVSNLCPVRLHNLLRTRAMALGVFNSLWCSDTVLIYKQSSAISRFLRNILRVVGIPVVYAAYSVRHALITFLFDRGLSEIEVNAYTGHSHSPHTALNSYFHLDSKWMGTRIAEATIVEDAKIEAIIVADIKVLREEEGDEQLPAEPEGMSEEDAQRRELEWADE